MLDDLSSLFIVDRPLMNNQGKGEVDIKQNLASGRNTGYFFLVGAIFIHYCRALFVINEFFPHPTKRLEDYIISGRYC